MTSMKATRVGGGEIKYADGFVMDNSRPLFRSFRLFKS